MKNKCSYFQYTAGRVLCWSVSQQYAWTSQALRSSKRSHFYRKYLLTSAGAHLSVSDLACLFTSLTQSCFIFFSSILIYQGPVFLFVFLKNPIVLPSSATAAKATRGVGWGMSNMLSCEG